MFALKTSSMTPFAVIFTANHKLIPCQTASAIGYWLSFFICVANFLSQKKQQKRIYSTEACDCFFFFNLFLNFIFYLSFNLLMKSISPSTCLKRIQINQITSLSILECGLMWRCFEKWFSQQDTNQMIWMFVHHNRIRLNTSRQDVYFFSPRLS